MFSNKNFLIKNIFVWVMLLFLCVFVGFGLYYKYLTLVNKIEEEQSNQLAEENILDNEDDVIPIVVEEIPDIYTLPPDINANAYLVVDVKSNETLLAFNSKAPLPPASLTKIMTAIIAMENYSLSKTVVVPSQCVGINGTSVGFKANEVFTLEDLLYGLLVKSGADAACAIASISSEEEFLKQMNDKAKEIGLENTVFQNEIGFDAENHQLMSAEDIKKLSLYALDISTFRKIVGTKSIILRSLNSSNSYTIQSTNDLLFTIPGTVGIKTGLTEKAGECLSYLYQNRNREILIVILGSQNRFTDTTALLEWANNELDYKLPEL